MNYMGQNNTDTRLELGNYLNAPQKQEKNMENIAGQVRECGKSVTLAAA